MKVQKLSTLDNILYYVMAVFTLGSVWLMRVIITKAIEKAFRE